MSSFTSESRTLSEQTQQWIHCLPNASQETREAFTLWLKASPEHVHSYLRIMAVSQEYVGFDASHEIDVDQLIQRARGNVVPLGSLRAPPGSTRERSNILRLGVVRWLAAAIIAGLGMIAWLCYPVLFGDSGWQDFTTHTGQQQQFKLADGSIVNLNAETSVRARVTPNKRDVFLVSGEALFDIKHDPGRPFRVHVDGMTIEDVGTQFNVYKRTGATKISVIDGEVRVFPEASPPGISLLEPLLESQSQTEPGYVPVRSPVPICAGRTASLTAKGREIREAALDLQEVTAWRQRMLVFRGSSLREIAAEFNRFNTEPRIRIDTPEVGNRRFSGIFRADDPKSFIAFLQQETDLAVDTEGSDLVIAQR